MFESVPVAKFFGQPDDNTRATKRRDAQSFISKPFTIAFVYLATYVALDWISYLDALDSSGITPWNPTTGLTVAVVIALGRKYIPLIFFAALSAEALLRGLPLPAADELSLALLRTVIFGAMLWGLAAEPAEFAKYVTSGRELFRLLARATVAAILYALLSTLLLNSTSVLKSEAIPTAFLESVVGDAIGVMTLTPFLLVALKRGKFFKLAFEALFPAGLLILALATLFGFSSNYQYQFFYPLFLPIIWVAVRFGFDAVVTALLVTHICLIVGIELAGTGDRSLTSYQIMMLILSTTGLTVGSLVSEQRRTEHELWLHREALERSARASHLGALAATIAHEINQPLTAVNNYVQNVVRSLNAQSDRQSAIDAATAASLQVTRAAEVVKRVRDYVSSGGCALEDTSVAALIMAAVKVCDPDLAQKGVVVDLDIPPNLPLVRVDQMQIEQVIINLVKNAAESIDHHGSEKRVVGISARVHASQKIEIVVADTGAGFDPVLLAKPMRAFTTTKPDGMGLGLSLCRSILKAHGGALTISGNAGGARVSFMLPLAPDHVFQS